MSQAHCARKTNEERQSAKSENDPKKSLISPQGETIHPNIWILVSRVAVIPLLGKLSPPCAIEDNLETT